MRGWCFSWPAHHWPQPKDRGRQCWAGFWTSRTRLIHLFVSAQYFQNWWLSNSTFNLHKVKEEKMNVNVLYFSQWKAKGESADCSLVLPSALPFYLWFIFACQNNDKLSTSCYFFFPPAFGCYLPACTLLLLPNKSYFLKRSAEWAFLGLKGPYRIIPIFYVCYFGEKKEKKICTGWDAIEEENNAF